MNIHHSKRHEQSTSLSMVWKCPEKSGLCETEGLQTRLPGDHWWHIDGLHWLRPLIPLAVTSSHLGKEGPSVMQGSAWAGEDGSWVSHASRLGTSPKLAALWVIKNHYSPNPRGVWKPLSFPVLFIFWFYYHGISRKSFDDEKMCSFRE